MHETIFSLEMCTHRETVVRLAWVVPLDLLVLLELLEVLAPLAKLVTVERV